MQKILSNFDIHTIAHELHTHLSGSYIDKIYQPERDVITLKINNKKENKKQTIYIKNESFLCLTTKSIPAPQKPSMFAMTCRKYLANGVIIGVTQHEFDRIITFHISKKDGDYCLIVELFKNGNIILTRPDNTIILPLTRQQWATRTLKSRQPYQPPPGQTNPLTLTKEELIKQLTESTSDLVRTLATGCSLGGAYAEELCNTIGIDKRLPSTEITEEQYDTIYQGIQDILRPFREHSTRPTLILNEEGTVVDITPVPLTLKRDTTQQDAKGLFTTNLELLLPTQQTTEQKTTTNKHQQNIGRLQRQLASQEQTLKKFEKRIELKQQEGDLIYLHFQTIDTILTTAQQTLKSKDKSDISRLTEAKTEIQDIDTATGTITLTLPDLEGTEHDITLDIRKNAADNADSFYKQSKKNRSKLQGAHTAMENTKKQLTEAEKKSEEYDDAQEQNAQRKKTRTHWYERYRWFLTTQGNLVIAGRDAKTNDVVVKKHLQPGDRYAHADIHGAPSCVIKASDHQGKPVPITDASLEESCIFAASYSRAWNHYAEAQAYWVNPEQVSQTAQSGEYVPRGAFIIRGKRNYHRITLELAMGAIEIDGEQKLMAGPTSAVQYHCSAYVILRPGGVAKKQTISKLLAKAFDTTTEVIDRALPPGNCVITETKEMELPGKRQQDVKKP